MDKQIAFIRNIAITVNKSKIIPKKLDNIINTLCCNYCNKRLTKIEGKK